MKPNFCELPSMLGCPIYRHLVAFYMLATAISWGFWLPLTTSGGEQAGQSSLKYPHLLGGLGPAISAVTCCWYFGGRPALGMLVERILLWRVP